SGGCDRLRPSEFHPPVHLVGVAARACCLRDGCDGLGRRLAVAEEQFEPERHTAGRVDLVPLLLQPGVSGEPL
ncbi:MAG: hypothetical protein LBV78_25545, partial [Kitasatospora sp.]|nr:hypothetical protein [Kitasatospora sp.]